MVSNPGLVKAQIAIVQIEQLTIKNFKKFIRCQIDFDSVYNLGLATTLAEAAI
jgi:hypothetical protein